MNMETIKMLNTSFTKKARLFNVSAYVAMTNISLLHIYHCFRLQYNLRETKKGHCLSKETSLILEDKIYMHLYNKGKELH